MPMLLNKFLSIAIHTPKKREEEEEVLVEFICKNFVDFLHENQINHKLSFSKMGCNQLDS